MAQQAIDASVAVKWVVKHEPFRDQARQLLRDSRLRGTTLVAPPLLLYELESVLQRRLQNNQATLAGTDASLGAFYATGVRILSHPDMVRYARDFARRFRQERIYDSIYAALAYLTDCEFWTADKAFYDAVHQELAFVKYLADYA